MNKLFSKIATLSVGLAMAVGVGVALGQRDVQKIDAAGTDTTSYTLVTDVSALETGKSYLITGGKTGTVQSMSTASKGNNRDVEDLTVTNGAVVRGANALSVTLGGSTGAWTFATENYAGTAGYLNATSTTSSNYLKVIADLDNYAKFSISFDTGDKAVITCTGKSERNIVRYNSSSSIISCYTSGCNDVYLWKEAGAATSFTVSYSANGATSGTVPTDANVYSLGDQATVLGNTGNLEKTGYTFNGWTYGGNTYQAGDKVTVNSNVTLSANWYENDSLSVIEGKESNEIYTGAPLDLSTCVDADGSGALSFDVDTTVNYIASYTAETYTLVADNTNTGGPLTITAHKGSLTAQFTVTVIARPQSGQFEIYSDAITEGDYVIYYNGYLLNASITSNKFTNGNATPADGVISNPEASTIWHIEQNGEYWTLYNEETEKYAGGTTTKNQGALLASVTDYAKWTVTGTNTYQFVNKGREEGSGDTGNKYLRNNGASGWACYGSGTGGALSLYKKSGSTATLESITLAGTLTKTTYQVGEAPSAAGLTVTANYDDDSHVDVTSKATITPTPATLTEVGNSVAVSFTASYGGKTSNAVNTTVTVNEVEYAGEFVLTSNTTSYKVVSTPAEFKERVNNVDRFTVTVGSNVAFGTSAKAEASLPQATSQISLGKKGGGDGTFSLFAHEGYAITKVTVNAVAASNESDVTFTVSGYAVTVPHDSTYRNYVSYPMSNSASFTANNRMWIASITVEVTKATPAGTLATKMASTFIEATAAECEAKNVTLATWNKIKNAFTNLETEFASEAALVKDADETNPAIARYKVIIEKYGYDDFLNKGYTSVLYTPVMNFDNNAGYVIIIAVITLSAIALGVVVLTHKRKHQ